MVDFYLPLNLIRKKLSPLKDEEPTDPLKSSSQRRNPLLHDDPFIESNHLEPRLNSTITTRSLQKSTLNPPSDTRLHRKKESTHLHKVTKPSKSCFIKSVNLERVSKAGQEHPNHHFEASKSTHQSLQNVKDVQNLQTGSATQYDDKDNENDVDNDQDIDQDNHQNDQDIDNSEDINDLDVPLNILEDMEQLESHFPSLSNSYRLIDKIGEGTFSTVYKAEALNGSVQLSQYMWASPPVVKKKSRSLQMAKSHQKRPIVALKQIYVTSSPNRIYNELKLLYILTGNVYVAPLLDVIRHQDQVLAVMPFYQHSDYRDFYRDLPLDGIKKYMWELFLALSFVHLKDIIHRDLKPTNFLYNPFKGRGVLVDFGLAERVDSSKISTTCPCLSIPDTKKGKKYIHSHHSQHHHSTNRPSYPKHDQRPPRRANRAGTRGFRAPEVLFKCTNQLTKLDIWSVGIIGLLFLTRKFPLLNSPDDIDALLELVLVFGLEKIQKCAELHGCLLDLQLPYVSSSNPSGNLVSFISKFLRYEWENDSFPEDSVVKDTLDLLNEEGTMFESGEDGKEDANYVNHVQFMELLKGCFKMDPLKRLLAQEALQLPLFEDFRRLDDEIML